MKNGNLEINARSLITRLQIAFYILFFGKITIDGRQVLEAVFQGKENLQEFEKVKKRFLNWYGVKEND